MNRDEVWKNFDLGSELDISGSFIYNGLKCFHEMRTLDHTDEIFEFFYNLSVGLERLLKVTVIMLEHDTHQDQKAFERSMITHNHLVLLQRVKAKAKIDLANVHNEFLGILSEFYTTFRYDRFTVSLSWNPDKEKQSLHRFLEKHLNVSILPDDGIFANANTARVRTFIGNLVKKLSIQLYQLATERARDLNLYSYERRSDSKASKIFLREEFTFREEDILWKEVLIYFMNTKEGSQLIDYLRSIEPLELDPALAPDYLQCFQSEEGRQAVRDEIEALYDELEDRKYRFAALEPIGNPMVLWDLDEEDEFDED